MQSSPIEQNSNEQQVNIELFTKIFTTMNGNPLIFDSEGISYMVQGLRVSHGINTQCIVYSTSTTRTLILFNPDNNVIEAQEGGNPNQLSPEQISDILTKIETHFTY